LYIIQEKKPSIKPKDQDLFFSQKRVKMTKKERKLNPKMREIIRILHKKGGAMSPNEIAEETGFSYATVKKYLKQLEEMGVIIPHG
jgi:uncharacterized membrane protein